jgi:ribonuclease Z
MRVVILGTSPPNSAIRPGRAGTGVLVSSGDTHVLVDCGPGVTRRLATAGVDLRNVDHVLLTHHHWDHLTDLPVFVMGRWERSAIGSAEGQVLAGELTILGPVPTERIVALWFGEDGILSGDIKTRTAVDMGQRIYAGIGAASPLDSPVPVARDVGPGPVLETSHLRVTAAEAQHTQPYLSSLAYRIDSDAGSVVLSGDTAPSSSVVELARGADLLLHEGAMPEEVRSQAAMETVHSSPETVGLVAAEAEVRQLVIVHHHLELADHDARASIVRKIGEHFVGEIVVAHELDEFLV